MRSIHPRVAVLSVGLLWAAAACTPHPSPTPPDETPTVTEECDAGEPCSASATAPNSSVTVVSATGSAATIVIGINDGPPLDCPGYDEINQDTYTIDVTAPDRPKTITLTYPYPGTGEVEVCYGSPVDFTPKIGTTTTLIGSEWVGLLPSCSLPTIPCKSGVSLGANAVVTVSLPPGDPRMK